MGSNSRRRRAWGPDSPSDAPGAGAASRFLRRAFSGAVVLAVVALGGCTATPPTATETPPPATEDHFTPLVPQILSTPRWFTGTDEQVHLVYEVQLTNGLAVPVDLESVSVTDSGDAVAEFDGDQIGEIMSPLGSPVGGSSTVPSSSVAVLWMELVFPTPDDLPVSLTHTFSVGLPEGVPLDNPSVYATAPVEVDRTPPVVLGPPLTGDNWFAAGSCCDGPHRRALQPVNDTLALGQRFAVDWNGMDDEGYMVRGDHAVSSNWVFYGSPVLAVADGTVMVAEDYLPDQIPDAPSPVGIEDADGNHVVLDIGDGRYVFYAHLEPGSVAVKAGDEVCAGQQIGALGNTGSSGGPHLHMHVSDAVSALDADGLPWVIEGFELVGEVPPLEDAIPLVEADEPLPIDRAVAGERSDELPLGQDVVNFPDGVGCD